MGGIRAPWTVPEACVGPVQEALLNAQEPGVLPGRGGDTAAAGAILSEPYRCVSCHSSPQQGTCLFPHWGHYELALCQTNVSIGTALEKCAYQSHTLSLDFSLQ